MSIELKPKWRRLRRLENVQAGDEMQLGEQWVPVAESSIGRGPVTSPRKNPIRRRVLRLGIETKLV